MRESPLEMGFTSKSSNKKYRTGRGRGYVQMHGWSRNVQMHVSAVLYLCTPTTNYLCTPQKTGTHTFRVCREETVCPTVTQTPPKAGAAWALILRINRLFTEWVAHSSWLIIRTDKDQINTNHRAKTSGTQFNEIPQNLFSGNCIASTKQLSQLFLQIKQISTQDLKKYPDRNTSGNEAGPWVACPNMGINLETP